MAEGQIIEIAPHLMKENSYQNLGIAKRTNTSHSVSVRFDCYFFDFQRD
mgnify:CR=1 FL=1|jgi:hypothetical protein